MKRHHHKKTMRHGRRAGQTLIEFAVCFPIILLLTMGLVQFGLIYNTAITLTNLSREGVRYAAVHGTETSTILNSTSYATDTAIRTYIRQAAASTTVRPTDLPDSAITVSPGAGSAARISGQPVTVVLNYDMRKKLFLPSRFMGVGFNTSYSTTTTMIIE
jgi:Flp pilus assembly protein TadG